MKAITWFRIVRDGKERQIDIMDLTNQELTEILSNEHSKQWFRMVIKLLIDWIRENAA